MNVLSITYERVQSQLVLLIKYPHQGKYGSIGYKPGQNRSYMSGSLVYPLFGIGKGVVSIRYMPSKLILLGNVTKSRSSITYISTLRSVSHWEWQWYCRSLCNFKRISSNDKWAMDNLIFARVKLNDLRSNFLHSSNLGYVLTVYFILISYIFQYMFHYIVTYVYIGLNRRQDIALTIDKSNCAV